MLVCTLIWLRLSFFLLPDHASEVCRLEQTPVEVQNIERTGEFFCVFFEMA